MGKFTIPWLSVLGVYSHGQRLAVFESGDQQVDLVIGVDPVVVFWVGKVQGDHALLLQVGFVNTGEASGDDCNATEVARFESSVLTRRAFSIVHITNDNPLDAIFLVLAG